jgi:RNA-directed DNA polymerase
MVARPNNPTPRSDSEGDAFAKARELQRGLYVAAKRQPERRFHALYDRIWRGDVLLEAWKRVRSNKYQLLGTIRYPGGRACRT